MRIEPIALRSNNISPVKIKDIINRYNVKHIKSKSYSKKRNMISGNSYSNAKNALDHSIMPSS
jgi:hypothetical protein